MATESLKKLYTANDVIACILPTKKRFWHNMAAKRIREIAVAHPSPMTATEWEVEHYRMLKTPKDHEIYSTLSHTLSRLTETSQKA